MIKQYQYSNETLFNYEIGGFYKYTNSNKKFKLVSVTNFIFRFKCGHWCTDCVFVDLINVRTKLNVLQETQLELF